MNEFNVITLCGSVRLGLDFWKKIERDLTLRGNVVLSVSVWGWYKKLHSTHKDKKKLLDAIHKQKILMSDEIFVLNVSGYIGPSTKSEIQFALDHGKVIRFLEKVPSRISKEILEGTV